MARKRKPMKITSAYGTIRWEQAVYPDLLIYSLSVIVNPGAPPHVHFEMVVNDLANPRTTIGNGDVLPKAVRWDGTTLSLDLTANQSNALVSKPGVKLDRTWMRWSGIPEAATCSGQIGGGGAAVPSEGYTATYSVQ